MELTIRRAAGRDIPAVMKLLHEVLEVHAHLRPDIFISGTTKYTEEELLKIFANDKAPVFVAVDENDKALGHLFCILQEHEATPNSEAYKTLYIDDLCVDEAARGLGIAKKLYAYACDYAKSLGCFNVTLHVWEGNDGARRFYEKMGMGIQSTTMEQVL